MLCLKLRALHLAEIGEKRLPLSSLAPLESLGALEYLALGRIRTGDRSLTALLELPQLKAVEIDRNAGFLSGDIEALRTRSVRVSRF